MAVYTILIIPDMLAQCPFQWNKNPYYDTAGAESIAWLNDYFEGEKLEQLKRARTDLLIGSTYAQVDREFFRMCADNMNLLFVVDDVSDVQDGDGARQTMEIFIKALHGESCEDNVISRMSKE
jgi:hypothetical protein